MQTGVKSFGWENRIAQPLPIQSWKLIVPWVVSAVKFGASELIRSDMMLSLSLQPAPEHWIATAMFAEPFALYWRWPAQRV